MREDHAVSLSQRIAAAMPQLARKDAKRICQRAILDL
jgi:hypothetical protein